MRTRIATVTALMFIVVGLPGQAQEVGAFTCGVPVEHESAALYPMPHGDLWGFVDATGAWVIVPAFERVGDFSEGRAVVAEHDSHWGVIDEAGAWVHEPTLGAQSYSELGDRRVHTPPLEPYSEGCSAGVGATRADSPFFLDRSGNAHWKEEPPAALAGENVLRYGSFSEGKAWFHVFDFDSDGDHGFIDAQGEIVLPAAYRWTGDFVGGLAPVETPDYEAAFIGLDGEPVVPPTWTLDSAKSFSGGLAQVHTGPFDLAYLRANGDFAFTNVTDPSTGESLRIADGGSFSEGLVALEVNRDEAQLLVYARDDGSVAFIPSETVGAHVCSDHAIRAFGEFRGGLARLMVVSDPSICSDVFTWAERADYEGVEYVYVDQSGQVVLRSSEVAAPVGE